MADNREENFEKFESDARELAELRPPLSSTLDLTGETDRYRRSPRILDDGPGPSITRSLASLPTGPRSVATAAAAESTSVPNVAAAAAAESTSVPIVTVAVDEVVLRIADDSVAANGEPTKLTAWQEFRRFVRRTMFLLGLTDDYGQPVKPRRYFSYTDERREEKVLVNYFRDF